MGRDKNGMGNRGLKELIRRTHGCEMKGGMLEGWWGQSRGGIEGKNLEKL